MKTLSLLCCSVLRREVETFLAQDYPEAELVFLDSTLHMHPEQLRQQLDAALAARPDRHCLLVYGDCHARMRETCERPNCWRIEAVNCADLLLGRERYRTLRNSKAFVFLPEWTHRWREVFQHELGFSDPALAREFMRENQRSLVYVDTGLMPVPTAILEEISAYFAMPLEVVGVSPDHLHQTVRAAVEHLMGAGHGR